MGIDIISVFNPPEESEVITLEWLRQPAEESEI